MSDSMRITILGLSITSSWGNGHATNYRGLSRELVARGHEVLFLERDRPWYATNRDLTGPLSLRTRLYGALDELRDRFREAVQEADLVIVGSFVPDGIEVAEWVTGTARGVTAFYDIDTPVTLAKLEQGDGEYLVRELVPRFDLYLSFAGGASLDLLRDRYGARRARPFYCSFDPEHHHPEEREIRWDLGYLGTYSADRQPGLERRMLAPARDWPEGRFAVVGPQYPDSIEWPANVERIRHLSPARHREFYRSQRFTLNLTRRDMIRAGHSPSVRLFEAAGCATPVISDDWTGLGEFFEVGSEILVADTSDEVLRILRETSEEERASIGERARRRVLREHTAAHRAIELERHVEDALEERIAGAIGVPGRRPRARRDPPPVPHEIEELAPWFHNLHLGDGVQTRPDHPYGDFPRCKWESLAPSLPSELDGWRALDVGCNAGFYAFELARRGAEVLGIDSNEHYLRQARWAAEELGLSDRVGFRRMQVYDLARLDARFDLVLFMGVLYHLRYPLLALDLVAGKVDRLMVLQTLTMPGDEVRLETALPRLNDRAALREPGWPAMAFVEETLAGDPTNWWVPNHACVLATLRSCGMRVTGSPGHEMYLCTPDPDVRRIGPDLEELRAATGTGAGTGAEVGSAPA